MLEESKQAKGELGVQCGNIGRLGVAWGAREASRLRPVSPGPEGVCVAPGTPERREDEPLGGRR